MDKQKLRANFFDHNKKLSYFDLFGRDLSERVIVKTPKGFVKGNIVGKNFLEISAFTFKFSPVLEMDDHKMRTSGLF
jgi:hypothetical protein